MELDRERQRQWKESLPEDWTLNSPPKTPSALPSWEQLEHWQERRRGIGDPTRLVIMDEADRLRMASLKAARAIFGQGGVGLVLGRLQKREKVAR